MSRLKKSQSFFQNIRSVEANNSKNSVNFLHSMLTSAIFAAYLDKDCGPSPKIPLRPTNSDPEQTEHSAEWKLC